MKKIILVLAAVMASGMASGATVEERYNQSCHFCHSTGAAGAPKTGDKAAWEPRLAKGMDALVASAKNGIGAMPPKGMCNDCSDEEFKALIEYMVK